MNSGDASDEEVYVEKKTREVIRNKSGQIIRRNGRIDGRSLRTKENRTEKQKENDKILRSHRAKKEVEASELTKQKDELKKKIEQQKSVVIDKHKKEVERLRKRLEKLQSIKEVEKQSDDEEDDEEDEVVKPQPKPKKEVEQPKVEQDQQEYMFIGGRRFRIAKPNF